MAAAGANAKQISGHLLQQSNNQLNQRGPQPLPPSSKVNLNNRPQSVVDKSHNLLSENNRFPLQPQQTPDRSSSSESSPFPLAHMGGPQHQLADPRDREHQPSNSSISPSAITRNMNSSAVCDSSSSSLANSYAIMQQQSKQGMMTPNASRSQNVFSQSSNSVSNNLSTPQPSVRASIATPGLHNSGMFPSVSVHISLECMSFCISALHHLLSEHTASLFDDLC